ncbi:Putative hypothetical protein [Helicobacter mustelae 12198]|uniref:Uncharacterized protein n=1 Tax=Helicobacter mustelae (strain ATCC 43772 / CCUG 25715 / CIP 103759 / LMG 18044 / NCTC 12198 / R85-136P) TaxID=679897 RepID=D3UFU0_HELM1|nr:Putative hypothetical protein [Helicobacter mustelae 12198]
MAYSKQFLAKSTKRGVELAWQPGLGDASIDAFGEMLA